MSKKPLTRSQKLEILKEAEEIYDKYKRVAGMCYCLEEGLRNYITSNNREDFIDCEIPIDGYSYLWEIFPEFKPSTFGLNSNVLNLLGYWWDIKDTISREKAFDKLIEIYS